MVKGEVKGGEASKGPARTDHPFAYPAAKLIQDRPLDEFDPPKGLQPLAANVFSPVGAKSCGARFSQDRREPRAYALGYTIPTLRVSRHARAWERASCAIF